MKNNSIHVSNKEVCIAVYLPKPVIDRSNDFTFSACEIIKEGNNISYKIPKSADKELVDLVHFSDISYNEFFSYDDHGKLHLIGYCKFGVSCEYEI